MAALDCQQALEDHADYLFTRVSNLNIFKTDNDYPESCKALWVAWHYAGVLPISC
jgi:hypothetical protein